jgi:hypothetical protein
VRAAASDEALVSRVSATPPVRRLKAHSALRPTPEASRMRNDVVITRGRVRELSKRTFPRVGSTPISAAIAARQVEMAAA